MIRRPFLYAAFVLSGTAGLIYEVVWTRYLALYVGHSAYAQIVVLAVYLGGMALGAALVSRRAAGLGSPLRWYAAAEGALAVGGLIFHTAFVLVTTWAYDVVFPALAAGGMVTAFRWGSAALLVLPPAVILGTTFPLMAAAFVRAENARPGRGVAAAYLSNSLGGAAGVILAGFFFIGWFGLPGTLASAALLNAVAAGLALLAIPGGGDSSVPAPAPDGPRLPAAPALGGPWASNTRGLVRLLLTVSFGTAVASFAYEIGWIRMLSLVLGSATHAFELMLSAFILGIGVGAWLIKDWTDGAKDPLRLLGGVQVIMGLAAVATLPVYLISFEVMRGLVGGLPAQDGGYAIFHLGRYALCLAVMLPSTVMAGMTLPVITGTLLRAGQGEEVIGSVYSVNTLGSVVGVGLAGLVLLPVLGLRGLIVAGAALDVALGVVVLRASLPQGGRSRLPLVAGAASAAVLILVLGLVRPDTAVMTSGVFRTGELLSQSEWSVLFYRDGRTATVSSHETPDGLRAIATNGKPDASLESRWLTDGPDTVIRPIDATTDFTTQVLAPMVTLAYAPEARRVGVIGHGSGMSSAALLASETLEELVTVEIEPAMVEGSQVFLPANAAAFDDPRSRFVFGDARSHFAASPRRFDAIFAEPSNPWVSGISSLFTEEFYRHLTRHLADDGVLGQWIQLYELNDDLFLSVVAALDAVFPTYRGYLVAGGDVAVVAGKGPTLPDPDWSVMQLPRFRGITHGAPPFQAEHMDALLLFDETTLRPLLRDGLRANSDFRPILDLGAERARFLAQSATGFMELASRRVDLRRRVDGEAVGPADARPLPAVGLEPLVLRSRAHWLRGHGRDAAPNEVLDAWQATRDSLDAFLIGLAAGDEPQDWMAWSTTAAVLESALHVGTWGWEDTTFVEAVDAFLSGASPPPEAESVIALLSGLRRWDWQAAAAAADVLVPATSRGETWIRADLLLDAAVMAYGRSGRSADAHAALDALGEGAGLTSLSLRRLLLEALAEAGG